MFTTIIFLMYVKDIGNIINHTLYATSHNISLLYVHISLFQSIFHIYINLYKY